MRHASLDERLLAEQMNQLLREPEPGLDEAMLWALCVAKCNRGERHGVDYKLAKKGFSPGGSDNPFVFIEIEETYHTRMLCAALQAIGLEVEFVPPQGAIRWVVEVFGLAPRLLTDVVALDAELTGVIVFRLLLDKARELFADQPGPLARIEALLRQILVDEVGHVHFLQSRLEPARLAIARRLLPLIVRTGDRVREREEDSRQARDHEDPGRRARGTRDGGARAALGRTGTQEGPMKGHRSVRPSPRSSPSARGSSRC
jgi:hypothetical protein